MVNYINQKHVSQRGESRVRVKVYSHALNIDAAWEEGLAY